MRRKRSRSYKFDPGLVHPYFLAQAMVASLRRARSLFMVSSFVSCGEDGAGTLLVFRVLIIITQHTGQRREHAHLA